MKMSLNRTYSTVVLLSAWLGLAGMQTSLAQNTAKNLFEMSPQTEAQPASVDTVSVDQAGLIDLDLRDQDIRQVLNLLSLQSQRNIIASPDVSGTISGRVYGADLYEVLDGLLKPYKLDYRESGNFIHIFTMDELKATNEANLKPVTRVIRLNYIAAENAQEIIKPVLSAAGSISYNKLADTGFEAQESDGGANGFAHYETLVIRDAKPNVEEAIAILTELDKRPEQVLIESTILRANLTENNQFGVDITAVADMTLAEATTPISVINDLVSQNITGSATAVQTSFGNSGNIATTGGTQVGIIRDGIAAFIHALDSVVDTTVVANPKLLVLNRQRAEVRDTLAQAVLITKTVDTTTSTSVETVDSGTKLRIRPFISSDNFIRMELKPEISSGKRVDLGETQGIDKDEQSMITNVIVRNGNTVVLGGLIREENVVSRQQTPVLGDIPVLCAAFRDQADTVTRTETIFLITPTIVRDDSLYAEGEQMKDNIRTAQFGSRQGLLPFSRSKMVADHMRNALQHHQNGNDRQALMCIEMALRLDPNFNQARALKASILNKLDKPQQRFFLDDYSKELINKELTPVEKVMDVTPQEEEEAKPIKARNQTAAVPVDGSH
ncbi:MAG TPA: hypothetical protein DCM28_06170 [Phycisphaerales bacterium]|nr:hypothetical protein [Phycisphaerales bacterium]